MENDLTLAICMYNAEQYIEETLSCIMMQTMQEFHLLIVNDCSTDGSVEKVKAFFDLHPRQYELILFDENKGLSAGRRYVEEHARTKYLLFVDADDCPYPALVERLYSKITSDKDLIAVGCYHHFIDSKGKRLSGGIFLGAVSKEEFYEKAASKKLIFMQPTAIIDLKAALSVGGRAVEGFPKGKPRYQDLCEDLDLWTRLSDLYVEGKAIVVVPEVLCRYRKHEQALSANSLGMILRMRHIKNNLLLRRAKEPEQTFIDFYNSLSEEEIRELKRKSKAADELRNGFFLLKRGKVWSASKYLFLSFIADPRYIWHKIKSNSGIFK